MSAEQLAAVIERAHHDGRFWTLVMEWPDEVCDEYGLTPDEIEALQSGDPERLAALGLDQRHVALATALVRP